MDSTAVQEPDDLTEPSVDNEDAPEGEAIEDVVDEPERGHVDPETVTEMRCAQCNTGASWKGPLTEDMLARTFTKGTYEAEDGRLLPNCPRCGTAMQLKTEPTAVEQAAQQLAGEPGKVEQPRQQSLPGVKPPFNSEAALVRIFEQRAAVRSAESYAETKHKDASRAKKHAEELQEELSKLEDDYAERYDELERERNLTPEQRADRNAQGCEFERRTGRPCVICREPGAQRNERNVSLSHAASAAIVAASNDALEDKTLVTLIGAIDGQMLTPEHVTAWSKEDRYAVASWLERKANDTAITAATGTTEDTTSKDRPALLGRAHIVGTGNACTACGEHVEGGHLVGVRVGLDCPGEPDVEEARPPKPRHATQKARQAAKQQVASAGDRHGGGVRKPGKKVTPAKSKPASKKRR